MRKIVFIIMLIINFLFITINSQEKKRTDYFGQPEPGDTAELFMPGIFNYPVGYHSSLIFTKDLKDVFYSPMTNYGEIRKIRNQITDPTAEKINFPSLGDAGDPFISPDNKRLYFLSFQPLDSDPVIRERIWYSEYVDGNFSKPKVVESAVYSHPTHWQFSVAGNYNLYFTSEIKGQENQDIYLSRYIEGKYTDPTILPKQVNSEEKELCPYISPEEKYLIFSRSGQGTKKTDLFISFKDNDEWSEAVKLPYTINSEGHDLCPIISPDGKFLFFISTRNGTSNIYWSKAHFLKENE